MAHPDETLHVARTRQEIYRLINELDDSFQFVEDLLESLRLAFVRLKIAQHESPEEA